MPNQSNRGRRWATTRLIFALVGIVLTFVTVRFMRGLFGRPVRLSDLRFPVLVLPPGNAEPFVVLESGELTTIPEKSGTSPANGTILIDADFVQYQETDVQAIPMGEIGQIFHALIPSPRSYKYKFGLQRVKTSGLPAAISQLAACQTYPGDAADAESARAQLAKATSMDDIAKVLRVAPEIPAAPAAPETAPTTEPATQPVLEGEQPP